MRLHEIIREKRKERGMTQEELAVYLGVSAPAVNKWERNVSFPDITFLPQLATLFHISVDELLGYEPQLTKQEIRRLYKEFSARFLKEPFSAVEKEVKGYVKQYYSCFPFVFEMAALLLNYASASENPQAVLVDVIELADRVETEAKDVYLVQSAREMKCTCYLWQGCPDEVFAMTDEEIHPFNQEYVLVAEAWAMTGNVGKMQEILQVGAYQHLQMLMSGTTRLLGVEEDPARAQEMIRRGEGLIKLFSIDKLQFNEAVKFYLTAAPWYCKAGRKEEALEMVEKYVTCVLNQSYPLKLKEDTYFNAIGGWIENLTLGEMAPRETEAVKDSILHELENPMFACISGETKFKKMKEKLQNGLRKSDK